jgi:transposase
VEAIAKMLGVSRKTIYRHLPLLGDLPRLGSDLPYGPRSGARSVGP